MKMSLQYKLFTFMENKCSYVVKISLSYNMSIIVIAKQTLVLFNWKVQQYKYTLHALCVIFKQNITHQ